MDLIYIISIAAPVCLTLSFQLAWGLPLGDGLDLASSGCAFWTVGTREKTSQKHVASASPWRWIEALAVHLGDHVDHQLCDGPLKARALRLSGSCNVQDS